MKNLDIRLKVSESGVTYKEIARVMGITPPYLSRLMASPLSEERKREILLAVDFLSREKVKANDV